MPGGVLGLPRKYWGDRGRDWCVLGGVKANKKEQERVPNKIRVI